MRQSIARLASVTALVTFGAMLPALANDTWYKHCKHTCETCKGYDNCKPNASTYTIEASSETDTAPDVKNGEACTVDQVSSLSSDVQGNSELRGVKPLLYRREGLIFKGVSPDYVKYDNVGGIRKPSQMPLKNSVAFYKDTQDGRGFQVEHYQKSKLTAPSSAGLYSIREGNTPKAITCFRNPDGNASVSSGRMDVVHSKLHPRSRSMVTTCLRVTAPQGNNNWKREWFMGDPIQTSTVTPYRTTDVVRTPYADGTESVREITKDLDSSNNLVITKDQTLKYGFYKYGEPVILEQTDHTGTGAELTTIWTYYTNRSDQASFNKPATMRRNDGQWANYTYTGSPVAGTLVTKTVTGWLDNPAPAVGAAADESANRVITEIEATGETGTFMHEVKVAGQLVSKSFGERYKSKTGELIEKTSVETGSSTLVTIRTGYPKDTSANEAERNRLKSVQYPDGTVEVHRYQMQGENRIETVEKGAGTLAGVTSGTRTASTFTKDDLLIKEVVFDIASSVELSAKEAIDFDADGKVTRWAYNHDNDDYSETIYGCCGVESERSRDGIVTSYSHDPLKRLLSETSNGITIKYTYGKVAVNGVEMPSVTRERSAGGLIENLGTEVMDHSGRTIQRIVADRNGDGAAEVTSIQRNPVTQSVKTIYPNLSEEIERTYVDGQMKSITGSAVAPVFIKHLTHSEQGGGFLTQRYEGDETSPRWTKTFQNLTGAEWKITKPYKNASGAIVEVVEKLDHYDAVNHLVSSTDADGVTELYSYNSEGERIRTALDLNHNGQIDAQDQVRDTIVDVVANSSIGAAVRTQEIIYDLSNNPVVLSTKFQSTDGLKSQAQKLGVTGVNLTVIESYPDRVDGTWSILETHPDGTKTRIEMVNGLPAAISQINTTGAVSEAEYTQYDALHRLKSTSDSRKNSTEERVYDIGGQISLIAERVPVEAGSPNQDRVTNFYYDAMGRNIRTILADGSENRSSYWPNGLLKASWGSLTNPTLRFYSSQKDLIELRTYRSTNLALAPDEETPNFDKTTWLYDEQGLMCLKKDPQGKEKKYAYTPAGRTSKFTNARGIAADYGYELGSGRLSSINYGDSTPDVAIFRDKLGRATQVKNGIAQSDYTYDPASLRLDAEAVSYDVDGQPGFDFTRVIDRSIDNFGRESGWKLKSGSTVENQADYGYSALNGRLNVVGDGSNQFTYSYVPGSSLIEAVTGNAHSVVNVWALDRDVLLSKKNQVGTTAVSQFDYVVDAIGQKRQAGQSGSAFPQSRSITWNYDLLGQVISADSSENNHDRAYQFDAIGNRRKSANSLSLPGSDNYTSKAGNQYDAVASLSPAYDDDGNAVSYPLPANASVNSALSWDADNRLVSVSTGSNSTQYRYDAFSRRIAKFVGGVTTLYLYDGTNCIGEYTSGANGFSLSHAYLWGMDQSGDLHSAGGIGGLLAVSEFNGAQKSSCYPTYDGNGNVSEYIDAAGAIAAHFEYDPFGNATVDTDGVGRFSYRFSTRHLDFNTGLYSYLYRWYEPLTGRWLSQDFLGEAGGLNLYAMLGNDALNLIDPLGLCDLGSMLQAAAKGAVKALVLNLVGKLAIKVGTKLLVGAVGFAGGPAGLITECLALCTSAWDAYKLAEALWDAYKHFDEIKKQAEDAIRDFDLACVSDEDCNRIAEALGALMGDVLAGSKKFNDGFNKMSCDLGLACFVAGTEIATETGGHPIEALRVGDRVLTVSGESSTQVDPQTWVKVSLTMPNPECSSDTLNLELLRPIEWLEGQEVGGEIWVELAEMGISGWASIHSIEGNPRVSEGRGRVILGTVTHYNTFVMEVKLEGQKEPLRPTDQHRLFSITRNDWTHAGELKSGEILRTESGQARVVEIATLPGTHRVFNLEVEEDHVYFVGSAQILSHNSCLGGRSGGQARLRQLATDDKISSADRGWIKQEMNSIERGQRTSIRRPPGKQLAHERGREAAKGYGYEHSNLQDVDLHRLQHKYDDFGRKNAERPVKGGF